MGAAWSFFPLPAPEVEGVVAAPSRSCWIMPDGAAFEVEAGGHAAALAAFAKAGLHRSSIPTEWMVPPHWIRVCLTDSELAVAVGPMGTRQAADTLAGLCRRIPIPDRAVLEWRSGHRVWEIPGCRNPALALAGAYMNGEK